MRDRNAKPVAKSQWVMPLLLALRSALITFSLDVFMLNSSCLSRLL
jgi:hypothetical protein